MRQAFAAKFGELEDKHIPAKEYVEKKLAELESGEFSAEPLTEVLSRDEFDPDTLLPHWNANGTLPLKKGGVLYLFAGSARKVDLATCLHQLGAPEQLDFHVECVDLLRHASHDLSVEKTRRSYLDRIANKQFGC